MDLEATGGRCSGSSAVLLTDGHYSVAANMERTSDCADGMPPDEIIYYSTTNTSQAALSVMSPRFALHGYECRILAVVCLAHDQVNA